MTTFDLYLIRRFLHVFIIGFISLFGLYVVMDGFTNVDNFQGLLGPGEGIGRLLFIMGRHYLFQSSYFFGLIGPILVVISTMVVFGLLQKHSEIYPILSAGVPTFRLMFPLLGVTCTVLLLIAANQELVIPQIAHQLQKPQEFQLGGVRKVTPVHDAATNILMTAHELSLFDKTLKQAEFVLPIPDIAEELTTLKAEEAKRLEATGSRPAGWLLRNARPTWERLHLSEQGRKVIYPVEHEPGMVFLISEIELDQFCDQQTSHRMLSTNEVIDRLKIPAATAGAFSQLVITLHERLTSWLVTLLAVTITIPLIVRKEKLSLVGNLATCVAVLALVLGITEGSYYLGRAHVVSLDLAAWLPVIFCGGLSATLSTKVQT
ncbi:MAG: LptF/LptG family permease [Planctomycetota bacterium]|nr:LptF/LptG family permease [Planctomycetota bacterium]